MFSHLLVLRNGSRESFDAGHVRYPLANTAVPIPPEVVAADVQRRQRPLGGIIIAISINTSS